MQSQGYRTHRYPYESDSLIGFHVHLPLEARIVIYVIDDSEYYHLFGEKHTFHFMLPHQLGRGGDFFVHTKNKDDILDVIHKFNAFLKPLADKLASQSVALFVGLSNWARYLNRDIRKRIVRFFFVQERHGVHTFLDT